MKCNIWMLTSQQKKETKNTLSIKIRYNKNKLCNFQTLFYFADIIF